MHGRRVSAVCLAIALMLLLPTLPLAYASPDTSGAAIAYRSNTGSLLNYPKYREWNPSTLVWTSELELPTAGSPVRFAQLEFSPISRKRVIVTLSDDGTLDGYVCSATDCTVLGNWVVTNDLADLWTTAPTGAQRPYDIAFEKTSGKLLLVYDRVSTSSTQDLFYRTLSADSDSGWTAEVSFDDTTSTVTDTVYSFIRLATDRTGGNKIGIIALDQTGVDAIAWIWNGSGVGNEHELTASASIGTEEAIGITFEGASGNLMIVAGEGSNVRYNRFTTSWQTSALVGGVASGVGVMNWITVNTCPGRDEIFMNMIGALNDYATIAWSGSVWETGTEHDAGIDGNAFRPADSSWSPACDGSGANVDGIIIWGTATGSVSFRRFTYPNTYSTATALTETGLHPWVQFADPPNPTVGDTVDALGATLDSTFDIGGLRWDGGSSNPVSTGDGGITSDTTVSTFEAFDVEWQLSTSAGPQARTITESVAVTESISRSGEFTRLQAESITASDLIGRIQDVIKSMAENIGASETIQRIFGVIKNPVESVSIADSLSRIGSFTRSISESIGITDVISFIQDLVRTISESISAVDVISSVQDLVRSISESVGVIDLISSVKDLVRYVSESVQVVDVVYSIQSLVRSISESIGVLDAIFRTIFGGQQAPEVGVPCTPYPDCIFPKPKGFAAIVLYELRMQPGETKENKIRLSLEGLKPLRTVEVLIFFSGPYLTWVSMARPMPILVEDIDKTKELDLPFWVITPSDMSPGTYEIPYDIMVSASPQILGYHGSFKVSIYREAAFDLSWTIPLASILLAILLIRRFARR